MKLSGRFLKCFFLICFSMYLSGSGVLDPNAALADDFSSDASRNLIYSPISSDKSLFSNIILAQTDKTEKDINTKDNPSEKIPSAFTLGYSVWYISNTIGGEEGTGTVDLGFHGPSLSYSFGKWSLSASFLMPMSKAAVDVVTYATGDGTTDSYMQYQFERYDGDLVLRRSFGMGNWMFGPQFGLKYMALLNCRSQVKHVKTTNGSNVTFEAEDNINAYGPSLGGIIAYVPGNPETSPVTFSLMANFAYLRLTGGNTNSPKYNMQTNMNNAGYDPNGTYYGLNIGKVPVHEVDIWIPAYSASFQMTYNILAGLNATVGGRYTYAKNREFYSTPNWDGSFGVSQSLIYLEYWGAFANLAYTW